MPTCSRKLALGVSKLSLALLDAKLSVTALSRREALLEDAKLSGPSELFGLSGAAASGTGIKLSFGVPKLSFRMGGAHCVNKRDKPSVM